MIPLGIYRTDKVSFAGLDPSYTGSDDEDDLLNNKDDKNAKKKEGSFKK
jgi:hypothetical protein